MDEYLKDFPTPPPLGPHHALAGDAEGVPADGLPLEVDAYAVGRLLAAPGDVPAPPLGEAGQALSAHTRRTARNAALALDALTARLRTTRVPDELLQQIAALGSLLEALPAQMAADLESSEAEVHGLFSRLLNAPRRPGAIEQVIDALAALRTAEGPLSEQEAAIAALRQAHRELVSLRQTWLDQVEAAVLEEFPELASPRLASESQVEAASPEAEAPSRGIPPRAASPLPARGVVVLPGSGRVVARFARLRSEGGQRGWLVLGLAVLVLLMAGIGVVLLHGRGTTATHLAGVALPGTTSTRLAATPTLPVSTPTAGVPAPTPTPPSPTPLIPPGGWVCPPGSAFCVSTLHLQLSCTGAASGTFQLLNNTANQVNWQANILPGPGRGWLTISPGGGGLEPAQQISLQVNTRKQQTNRAAIQIVGPAATAPFTVMVSGCG